MAMRAVPHVHLVALRKAQRQENELVHRKMGLGRHSSLSGAFRARWSAQIYDEWKRNLLENRRDLTSDQIDRTILMMSDAAPGTLVTEYEFLVDGLVLPDPDDHHVLAAAVRSNASVIVTFNQSDFLAKTLEPLGIEAQHPDEFAENLFDLDSAAVIAAAQRQRSQLKSPAMDVDRFLDNLLCQGLVQTVKSLGTYKAIL
jgi:predicted nucleic acid-binding protein